MPEPDNVRILLVDDKPEQLLALESVLQGPDREVVKCTSAREALRQLLKRDFAVILLDVNMPDMDGFETAQLIRSRERSANVPIIFITAYGDDGHLSKGYSLGAVDFIMAPVHPDILKTKVGVFVDLYRKTAEVRRQADFLRHRAVQLHKLTRASLAINSSVSMDKMFDLIAETARDIIGARQCTVTVVLNGDWSQSKRTTSVCEKREGSGNGAFRLEDSFLQTTVCDPNRAQRMTRLELEAHEAWGTERTASREDAPAGWLAAPLTGRSGANMGLLEVTDKHEGPFTGEDEDILVQLAQVTSIAMENTMYAEARRVNQIKDEFLATLSHELRTPLNAILGWTKLLKSGKTSSEDSDYGLEVIERNVNAQTRLIEDLLDVSRIANGKLRIHLVPVDLDAVIRAAVDSARPQAAAKRVTLQATLDPLDALVSGDADRLMQVAGNILSNAIKFTPSGGRIDVKLEPTDGRAQLRVADTGKGIRPEFLPHIFERFRQADSSLTRTHSGLGIGLAIARHIVEHHGGWISASSQGEGQGATFLVSLPLLTGSFASGFPADASTVDAGDGNGAALEGVAILIVDDEPDSCEVIGEILKGYRAKVTAVGSVAEAFQAMEAGKPDVIISDIAMPQEDGYSFIRKVRAWTPEQGGRIPAMALTAFASEENQLQALEAGFQLHLAKPVQPAALLRAVSTLLGGGAKAALSGGGPASGVRRREVAAESKRAPK